MYRIFLKPHNSHVLTYVKVLLLINSFNVRNINKSTELTVMHIVAYFLVYQNFIGMDLTRTKGVQYLN